MSNARIESLNKLKNWVLGRSSQVLKLAQGQGIAGTRAAPAQAGTNDTKIGSRLDHGEKVIKDGKEYKRYKWQLNKNAENSTLKELANKDSHKVWSEADVPVTSDTADEKERVEKLFADLKNNMKN